VLTAAQDFEQAGAVMVELELVAAPVAAMISRATALTTVSTGSGANCDVHYLFGRDNLGEPGRKPRHARAWDDFARAYSRLQGRRETAFAAFRAEALNHTYPTANETVAIPAEEFDRFSNRLDRQVPATKGAA
jgi:3-methyl-2-oxobutanoate hydroxymethyltransferase